MYVGTATISQLHGLTASRIRLKTSGLEGESSGHRYHIWSQARSDGERERLDNSFV